MKTLLFLVSLVISGACSAQNVVETGEINFNGQDYPCRKIEFDLNADLVEETISNKLKDMGYKPRQKDGFLVYRDVKLPILDNESKDVFIKVERKSRSDRDKSIVYFIAAKPGLIPDDKVKKAERQKDAGIDLPSGSAAYLNSLQPDIDLAAYNYAVLQQQDVVKKADKKLQDLADDEAKLQRKLKDLHEDMVKNCREQEAQIAELNQQRKLLQEKIDAKPAGSNVAIKE